MEIQKATENMKSFPKEVKLSSLDQIHLVRMQHQDLWVIKEYRDTKPHLSVLKEVEEVTPPKEKPLVNNQQKHPLSAHILDSQILKLLEKPQRLNSYDKKGGPNEHI